jgi:hypothetical protein
MGGNFNMKNIRVLVTLFLTVLMILFAVSGASAAAETFTESANIPLDLEVFVPCAAGGAGEMVFLSGSLHTQSHFTADGAGGFLTESHFSPQGVSGVGLTSGDKYQATGVTRDSFHVTGLPYESTFVNNFRIIGQGTGNNYLVHENFHLTVNANGEVTASVDNFRVECR